MYQIDDRVWITGTKSAIDGLTGSIAALSHSSIINFYIIIMDNPHMMPYDDKIQGYPKAVCLPEGCIRLC